jgi:cytochrome c oxidase subunit IV
MLKLLFGKVTFKRLSVILIPGILAATLVGVFHPAFSPWTWVIIVSTFDITSGLISNQFTETHQAWQKLKPIYAYVFIGFHALVYPIILLLIEIEPFIISTLLVLLTVKLYSFIRGYFLT